MKKGKKYINSFLFAIFFKIALLVIGGGLAMLPVIEEEVSKKRKLLSQKDVLDMIALTQTVPGLIAINSAVFVGHKLNGWKGSLCAVLGVMLPSLIIIMTIAHFFPLLSLTNKSILTAFDCVRAAVSGLFLVTVIRLARSVIKNKTDALIILILFFAVLMGVNSVYTILAAIGSGLVCSYLTYKKGITHD